MYFRDWPDTFLYLGASLMAGSVSIALSLGVLVTLVLTFSVNAAFLLLALFLAGMSIVFWKITVDLVGEMRDS